MKVFTPVLLLFVVHFASSNIAPEVENLIIYGQPVNIRQFPFFAGTEVCGASILSEWWLLTAAHCVDGPQVTRRKLIFVGGERRDNSKIYQYEKIVIHPHYVPSHRGYIAYDIALIRLQSPLTFSETVRPIQLPQPGFTSRKAVHVFVARGNDETGRLSTHLTSMNVVKLSVSECGKETMHHPELHKLLQENTLICARKVDGNPGLCNGDSGSPLLQNGVIVGLASFLPHKSCTTINVGFYTHVPAFVPWIKSITGLN